MSIRRNPGQIRKPNPNETNATNNNTEVRKPGGDIDTTSVTGTSDVNPVDNDSFVNNTGPINAPGIETPVVNTGGTVGGAGTLADLMLGRTEVNEPAVTPATPNRILAANGAPMANAIPEGLADIMHTTDDFDVQALNDDFGKPGPLAFKDGSDIFKTNTFIDVGMMLGAAGMPAESKLVTTLSQPENVIHMQPGHKQFALPELEGAKGNRLMTYGGESGHKNIATMIHELKDKGRLLKNMNHPEYIGGLKPSDHLEGEGAQHGVTHGGSFVPTTNADGDPDIGWLDWPANYGKMSSDDYWAEASLFSLDNVDFKKGEGLTPELKSEYYKNMDRLSVMQLMTVGFASDDANPENRDYKSNPLEIKQASDLKPYMDMVLSNDTEGLKHYSQYCQEGVWNNLNAGLNMPINQTSVDRGLISQESFDNFKEMVDVFNAGGGQEDPTKGYEALKEAGKITDSQLSKIQRTGMDRVPLDLAPDELVPWTDFEPEGVAKSGDGAGLFAKPFTISSLITGMMKSNFPREEITKQMAGKFGEIAAGDDAQMKAELGGLMQQMGVSPDGSINEESIQKLSYALAAGFQKGIVASDEMKGKILGKLKIDDMNEADKAEVNAFYDEVVETVGDPTLGPDALNAKLEEFDQRMRDMKVTIDGEEKGFMQFIPPHGITYLDQGIGDSVGLSYFTDLVHEKYVNTGDAPAPTPAPE